MWVLDTISYIDRKTGRIEKEEVYGENAVRLLYGNSLLSRTVGRLILQLFAKWPPLSWFYGFLQKRKSSAKKIAPFIAHYGVDVKEFVETPESFHSFNDFFVRHLKPEARPIAQGKNEAIIPADGRYKFFPKIVNSSQFLVKDTLFDLKKLLQDEKEAALFENGSLVMARLCPTDCHRFYFPFDCIPSKSRLINGKLFSVNPIATKNNPWIWTENRRVVTLLQSELFGTCAYIEVGATNVGSIIQTFTPNIFYTKGAEKGYFSFGGSAILLLFEKNRISFAPDLRTGPSGLEIRCLIGEVLGTAISA